MLLPDYKWRTMKYDRGYLDVTQTKNSVTRKEMYQEMYQ